MTIILTCPKCGSIDIKRDAIASWSPAKQEWEMSHFLDCMTCDDCGADFDEAAEIDIPEPVSDFLNKYYNINEPKL